MSKEIEEKVNEIIIDELGLEESEIKADANFRNDLGADSLDVVELTMALEKEFGISISDEQMNAMHDGTVGDVYNLIERLTK